MGPAGAHCSSRVIRLCEGRPDARWVINSLLAVRIRSRELEYERIGSRVSLWKRVLNARKPSHGGETMGNLTLADAFEIYGGKPASRLYSLSAMAADGAMILSCSGGSYGHPKPGVLRYEDRL